jgi:hypothetical protein
MLISARLALGRHKQKTTLYRDDDITRALALPISYVFIIIYLLTYIDPRAFLHVFRARVEKYFKRVVLNSNAKYARMLINVDHSDGLKRVFLLKS